MTYDIYIHDMSCHMSCESCIIHMTNVNHESCKCKSKSKSSITLNYRSPPAVADWRYVSRAARTASRNCLRLACGRLLTTIWSTCRLFAFGNLPIRYASMPIDLALETLSRRSRSPDVPGGPTTPGDDGVSESAGDGGRS